MNGSSFGLVAQSDQSTVLAEFTPAPRTERHHQTEAQLEAAFIAQLQQQAYEYLPISSEEELIANLRVQLEKLNHITFTDQEWQRFFETKIAGANESIEDKTNKLQQDSVQLLEREDGSTKNIRLIDKANIHNNSLQVLNQYETSAGRHVNRYDVTVLVNGLPLVHVELKRRGVLLREAFNQIERYQRDSFWAGSGLFNYVQIFVISNGTSTKYYANTTRWLHANAGPRRRAAAQSFEFTMWWADSHNQRIGDLVGFAATFFAKHTILSLLTRYCVFNTAKELLVMRPYQIVATERILRRIQMATSMHQQGGVQAGGYIWHTTGSGKTLTSFKTAQLATDLEFLDKVLFVVDRQDLDTKTMKDFNEYQEGAVSGTTSTKALKEALDDNSSKIVVTTIQKLSRFIAQSPNHLVYRQHVAIIFDECHRSQFGSMHQAITKAFKNYHLFGFTGTPIFADNTTAGMGRFSTTEKLFGTQLHTYTIVDATRDHTVLPFLIDYVRTVRAADQLDDTQVIDIDREGAANDPERIRNIVSYIIEHFDQKCRRKATYQQGKRQLQGFNSILATASIKAAKAYYAEFKRQEHNLKVATIFTFAPNEDPQEGGVLPEEDFNPLGLDQPSRDFLQAAMADYNQMFESNFSTDVDGFSSYHKDVSKKLEDREIDLLIVVNMFLTGFNSKTLGALWVDKNLKQHGLIQAFSRTNRILNSVKVSGQIVCFRNLEQQVEEAIALFGNPDAQGLVLMQPYAQYLEQYQAKVAQLLADYPLGQVLDDERGFIGLWGQILYLRNILQVFDQFTEAEWGFSERD
ncbi:MAG: HsdR family type I site-specific deoxyribonuclease, partial [Micrococcales bacterium]|nr:HsdR family type I site-specific deoxyribonuclease [Micrococcales bacterium]